MDVWWKRLLISPLDEEISLKRSFFFLDLLEKLKSTITFCSKAVSSPSLPRLSLHLVLLFSKYSIIVAVISQLLKMLQHWSLYDVIEVTLPFVLNTKQPLCDIWLLRYKQNSFGCFQKNSEVKCFQKTPKTILLISQQPNIAQRPFCIHYQNFVDGQTDRQTDGHTL